MSTPINSRREYPSTYFVQDRPEEELHRLQIQDQMLTASMGGVLPEQSDPTVFQSVLDVGCGAGSWLMEAARTYPTMSRLVGVDVSTKMVEYAQKQAEAQQVSDRVQFLMMDAMGVLGFPANSFDLVNERLGESFLRIWDWRDLLQELQRVTRPGGVIRVTGCDLAESNSPALNRLIDVFLHALYNSGHLFSLNRRGIIDELEGLLKGLGLENVQTRLHILEYRADAPEWESYCDNVRYAFRTFMPFFRKWTRLPDDYEMIYQQALSDLQKPGFVTHWTFLTAWGISPPKKSKSRADDHPSHDSER